jgi:UDP-glucose 4-epimerase
MKCSLNFFGALQFVKGDIQSADLVRHLLVAEEVDTIMHFAAQVLPR